MPVKLACYPTPSHLKHHAPRASRRLPGRRPAGAYRHPAAESDWRIIGHCPDAVHAEGWTPDPRVVLRTQGSREDALSEEGGGASGPGLRVSLCLAGPPLAGSHQGPWSPCSSATTAPQAVAATQSQAAVVTVGVATDCRSSLATSRAGRTAAGAGVAASEDALKLACYPSRPQVQRT